MIIMVIRDYIPEKAERPNSVLAFLSVFPVLLGVVFSITGHIFLYVNDENGSRSFFIIGFVASAIAAFSAFIALFIPRTKKILPLIVILLGLMGIAISFFYMPYLSNELRYWFASSF